MKASIRCAAPRPSLRTNVKSFGRTPSTWYGLLCSRTTEPTMAGSAPKRVHSSWVKTIVLGRPLPSSWRAKPRPSAGLTPSISNTFGVTTVTAISLGSVPSRMEKMPPRNGWNAATSSITAFCLRSSVMSVPARMLRLRSAIGP